MIHETQISPGGGALIASSSQKHLSALEIQVRRSYLVRLTIIGCPLEGVGIYRRHGYRIRNGGGKVREMFGKVSRVSNILFEKHENSVVLLTKFNITLEVTLLSSIEYCLDWLWLQQTASLTLYFTPHTVHILQPLFSDNWASTAVPRLPKLFREFSTL